ncbi:MAG: bifunctional UDP-N-acetylglucosamine pyrophosphorylase / Glucosamine-1-phosphate N-acetyltransferase [Parcubacteria group bacterium Gr01-1014_30]|nr:MAG: bifunctional UDP-N-acetylglucosamine pyrophosphorylase / Glucosamine-1-phosphate N-acetyltransferase [Parcubacteria group bacterium Gr01-1014_30]
MAAGESSRFWPLNKKHKSLFCLLEKPLILLTLLNLKKAGVKEVVILQGVSKDIESELKRHKLPQGLKIKYVVQKEPRGTGDALRQAANHLEQKFLVLYGDDFYGEKDLKNCLAKFPSVLLKETKNISNFGVAVVDKDRVKKIVEKPLRPPSNLVNAGGYFIPKAVLEEKIAESERGELEITDYINRLAQKSKVYFVKASDWFPLSFAWDLLAVNEFLLNGIKTKIEGKVEKNCHVQGPVFVGKRTIIKSGTYVEGPVWIGENCEIGPNCFLRPFSHLGDNCRIGHGVEIKNSVVSKGSTIPHLNYVGDSIIGENCDLGGGTVFANLRLDRQNVRSKIKGIMVDTGRKKLGAVLGRGVQVGVNSSLMPGVLVGENSVIGPHSLVRENVADDTIFYSKFDKVEQKRVP